MRPQRNADKIEAVWKPMINYKGMKILWRAMFALIVTMTVLHQAVFAQETKPVIPVVEVEKISFVDRMVTLKVRYAPDTISVGVYQDDALFHTEMISHDNAGTNDSFDVSVSISKESTQFYASAISTQSQSVIKSETLTVNRSDFEPSQPSLALQENEIVSPKITLMGEVDNKTVAFNVMVNGETFLRESMDPGQKFSIKVAVPYGENVIQLSYENVWGEKQTLPVTVWNLGNIPTGKTFVLVDKSEYRLYFIKQGILRMTFPVALGTPRTPTHEGWWFVGKKEIMRNPDTSWGILRLLLFTKTWKGKYRFTGYAIHGTNNPSSIGKEVSHGCVRLFNEDVLKLASIVGPGTEVLIRN